MTLNCKGGQSMR